MMKPIVDFSFKYWKWIAGVSALLTLICLYMVFQIKVDNSTETLSVDDDPKLLLLRELEEKFGGNEFIVVSFKGDDIFSPSVISMIDAITTNMEKIENVESVLSLTNSVVAQKDETGFGMDALVPEGDRSRIDMQALKEKVMSHQIYEKLIYSSQGNATSIIAWLVPLGNDDAARWRVMKAIKNVVNTHKDDRQFYLYGMPVYQEFLYRIMIQDQLVLPVVISVLMGCILYFVFRDIRLILLPFIVIDLSVLWSMGLFTMAGNTLDVVTFIIPSILLIVCLCVSVHILSEYRETCGQGEDRVGLVKAAVSRIGVPVMLTSLTTALGFFSLATSCIKSIRHLGVYTGLGVIFAFLASMLLLPLIMALLPVKKERKKEDRMLDVFEAYLVRLARWLIRYKGRVMVATILFLSICMAGALKLKPNMVILGMMKKSVAKDIIAAQHFVDVEMAGSCEFNVLVKSDQAGTIVTPDVLRRMGECQERLTSEVYGLLKTLSIVDYLKAMNQVLNDNDPAYYRIPDSQQKIDSIMMLYSMNEESAKLTTLINEDYSETRIRLFTYSADDSQEVRDFIDQIESIVRAEFDGGEVSAKMTSRPDVWVDMVESLTMEMLKTFSLAFILIFGLMFAIFRSWQLGLVSAAINVIPILVTFGCMGWLGIDLNMATAAMPSIAIGIAVDDTIHFIWRFEKEFRRLQSYPDALIHTLKTVGKQILITSILICTGFAVLFFSRLTVYTEFGLLLSLTVFAALLADLLIAPVLMLIFKPIKATGEESSFSLNLPEKEVTTD